MSDPLAAPHLQKVHELLSEAFKEADQAAGLLPRWTHGSCLDLRDGISQLVRDCRGLRVAAGAGAPEENNT